MQSGVQNIDNSIDHMFNSIGHSFQQITERVLSAVDRMVQKQYFTIDCHNNTDLHSVQCTISTWESNNSTNWLRVRSIHMKYSHWNYHCFHLHFHCLQFSCSFCLFSQQILVLWLHPTMNTKQQEAKVYLESGDEKTN